MAIGVLKVQAATTDGLTITITPSAGYDVDVDTTGVTLAFPGATTNTDYNVVLPATVTINSSLATTELQMDATMGGGWSLGTSNALDTLQAWALFTSTTVSTIPAKSGDNFDDTNDRIASGSQQVGDNVAFEDGSFNTDDMPAGTKAHMWFRFHTPATTTNASAKTLFILLTAQAPN
jgi:hypothetical protein